MKARAKINLTLDVTGKRPDGYHDLRMIMQTVALYDGVYLKRIGKETIKLKTNLEWLPVDERNLAYRAAKLIMEKHNISGGLFIELDKRIPVAAGLAGGSADCAAVLVGMNRLFRLGLSMEKLMKYGLTLGADIPFCILRGTALAEGIGEKLTPLPSCPFCFVVLAKPVASVSTAYVFQNLNLAAVTQHPDTEKMLEWIKNQNLEEMSSGLCNVLESVILPKYPQVGQIKDRMKNLGALGALMSGSGPTVYGLFREKKQAEQAAEQIRKEFGIREVFVTMVFHTRNKK